MFQKEKFNHLTVCKQITDEKLNCNMANIPTQAETLLHSLEQAAAGIGLHVNVHNTEYTCFNQRGDISTQDGSSLKPVETSSPT